MKFIAHLLPYSAHPRLNVIDLQVDLQLGPDRSLCVHYVLSGSLGEILIPAPLPSQAADELWQHTCLEAFVAVEGRSDYREFNFAPSGQWAAYAFSDYRVREESWQISQAPHLEISRLSDCLSLTARLDLVDLPANPENLPWQFGLTAVLETRAEGLSYWALQHPGAQPDFHDRRGFIRY